MAKQTKVNEIRLRTSRMQDLLHLFIFVVILIIFHIFLLQLSSKELNVDIKQKIFLQEEGPVIHLKSATKQKLKLLQKRRQENQFWDLPYTAVSTPYHLKYHPVRSWPAGLDDAERWKYFQTECSSRNVSEEETVNCAYDSEMFRRRLLIKKTCKDNKDLYDDQHVDAYKIFAMLTR